MSAKRRTKYLRLYHRTNHAAAIQSEGFRDAEDFYGTPMKWSGVWLSADRRLDENEGACGDDVLVVDVPVRIAEKYEWREDRKPYREFLIPAKVLNRCSPPRLMRRRSEKLT